MTLEEWRSQIDDLDQRLLDLLNHRARLTTEVARLKAGLGLQPLDVPRERAILSRARDGNRGPLDARAVARIFTLILSESRRTAARTLGAEAPRRQRDDAPSRPARAVPKGSTP
jgi:chorismate mutase